MSSDFRMYRTFTPGLNGSKDKIIEIRDLHVLFRVSADYLASLGHNGYLATIVRSILSVQWLCLEPDILQNQGSFANDPGAFRGVSNNRSWTDPSPRIPFFDLQSRRSQRRNQDNISYLVNLRLSHPISDKPYHCLSFSGDLVSGGISRPEWSSIPLTSFSSQLSIEEIKKNYLEENALVVPDVVFIAHIDLFVPRINRKKTCSVLVYADKFTLDNFAHPQLVSIAIDNEAMVCLYFSPISIDNSTPSGASAMKCLFPPERQLQQQTPLLTRFYLTKFSVEAYFPTSELVMSRENTMQGGQNGHFNVHDMYTINNTQNNYFFNNHNNRGSNNSGFFNHPGYFENSQRGEPTEDFTEGDTRSTFTHTGQHPSYRANPQQFSDFTMSNGWSTQAPQSSSQHVNSATPQQRSAYQRHDSHTNSQPQLSQRPVSNSSSAEVGQSPSRNNGHSNHSQQLNNDANDNEQASSLSSSNSDAEGRGEDEENPQGDQLRSPPTPEEILNDPKLFKKYSNSKSKNSLVHTLLSGLTEEQVPKLLETLKYVLKDICKNKYGNYVVQVIAKSLSVSALESLLGLLKPNLIQIMCHSKGTFAIQGVMSALKDLKMQSIFLDIIKKEINKLVKHKEGSYIIKEVYRTFDPSLLDEVTDAFMSELDKNVSDKFAVCIFKEIVVRAAATDKEKLQKIFKAFIAYFQEFKVNTFYHFGLQYFLEIFAQNHISSPELATLLLDFAKNSKNILRSRSTSETVLLSLSSPPTDAFRKILIDIILRKSYIKGLQFFKTSGSFLRLLRQKLMGEEVVQLDSLLASLPPESSSKPLA